MNYYVMLTKVFITVPAYQGIQARLKQLNTDYQLIRVILWQKDLAMEKLF